jgi:L-ascorbate metabolism protein UlaG (beta-lactamase superfamily)
MKITKFGHSCLLIEEQGLNILTDPGNYINQQDSVVGIDVVFITHEHGDHLHIDSLKKILSNNPNTKIFTNSSVGKLLDEAEISYTLLEHGQNITEKGVLFEAFGQKHHIIYKTLDLVDNTGYFIANKLFYPGDALTNPGKVVEILALPVNAPWLAAAEALDYAKALNPRICFPVHDGNLKRPNTTYRLVERVLQSFNISFITMEGEKEIEL